MSSRKETIALLAEKEFSAFLGMRFFLTIALQIQSVIVGWQVYKLTKDPLSLGLIGLAEAIPALGIALYAGHVADTSSKKKVLVYTLASTIFCSLGLLITTMDDFVIGFSETISLRCIYIFIFLSGIARGFYSPTGFSFLAQIVKRESLVGASTLSSSTWQIGAILGPAIGGICYAAFGITITFSVVLALSVLSVLALLMIRSRPVIPQPGDEGIIHRLTEGVKFVFKNKVVLSSLSLDLFAVLFGGAVALLPVYASEILRVGPQGLGMLRAAPSLGASITMIGLSVTGKKFHRPGIVLLYCVAAFGISILGFGLSTSFVLSLVFLVFSGAFDSVSVVIRANIIQMQTPDHMRGRVAAVNTMFIGSSNEIGSFESGVAAKLMGIVPSVVFGGCMTLLVVGFTAVKSKALKTFRY